MNELIDQIPNPMNTLIHIKINLDVPKAVVDYIKTLEKWENEGGRSVSADEFVTPDDLPVKPGELFKVRSGRLIFEDEQFYYLADIEKVSPGRN